MLSYVGDQQLLTLRSLLDASDEVFAAVAFVQLSGVSLIQKEVQALHQRPHGHLRLLTSLHFGQTQPAALHTLARLGTQIRIHQGSLLHAKVWLGRSAALLGSANLSASALLRNTEAGVHLTDTDARALLVDAHDHLEPLWQEARPYAELQQPLLVAQAPLPTAPLSPLQQQVVDLQARQPVVQTASGRDNHLLQVDALLGVRVGTARTPRGAWVPWEMLEVVEAWLESHPTLRLNPDCTDFLRVHRSSAVFAIFGALPGYRLHGGRGAWLERV